ncbi:MAG: aminoglycoside phosphotransferase family protein [bacterium]|nr:aminoglycoside phosphotransferase family protein [bacterium]
MPDHPRDPVAQAKQALVGAGLDPHTPLERAASHANDAWLGPDFALRVNWRGDLGRLAREALVAEALAPEARYPGVSGHGNDGQIEWILTRRVGGAQLGRAWCGLKSDERERAIHALAKALRALHSTDAPNLPVDRDLAPPHVLPLDRLLGLLHRAAQATPLDPGFAGEIEAFLVDRWPAFDDRGTGLVHGDPHLENVLWDGDTLWLLDLEWSRRSWLEVDLEILLSVCDHPELFVSEDYEHLARGGDYRKVPGWLRDAYPELFAHPRLNDRLAVLHIARTLTLLGPDPLRLQHIRRALA